MFSKIVVAVDGSVNSDRAVDAAAELAKAHGSDLIVCHVFYIPEYYRTDLSGSLRESVRSDAEKILKHATDVLSRAGASAEARLLSTGHPAEAVVGLAEEVGANLIVAGVRGKSPDQARAMGSVSSEIAESAGCSVLLVRHGRK
jgi:nucleotide-binding universal stress UspA family protein